MYKKILLSTVIACSTGVHADTPKNIIFMIGDGMGPAFISGYRYYKNVTPTPNVKPTIFDELTRGSVRTNPHDNTWVTDSAASATAYSTGKKSYNGAIGLDNHRKMQSTLLEEAKRKGMTTGLVATAQITHATPAAFVAHNESRRNYNEIADEFVDNKVDGKLPVDFILGGGQSYFIRDDRNLIEELQAQDYTYTSDFSQLGTVTSLPAVALFHDVAFPYAIDSDPRHLTKMTEQTLKVLPKNSPNGFFVMIEGSQIDWCAHRNDITCAMGEMDDFAASVKLAKEYVDQHPDTLLVVTADHSTGGLTLGANGTYKWDTEVLNNIHASGQKIADDIMASKDAAGTWKRHSSVPLSEEDAATLTHAIEQGEKALFLAVLNVINTKSYTGWTTTGHTAVDVTLMSYGAGADKLQGNIDNTQIAQAIRNLW